MPQTTAGERAGEAIRSEMTRQGVTQQQIAGSLQISQAQVSKRLRGLVPWRLDELVAIAELLDVAITTFLPDAA